MAASRTDMHQLQELIRLHRLGRTARAIARELGMGRDTVRDYCRLLRETSVLDGPVESLPAMDAIGSALAAVRPPKTAPQQTSSLESFSPRIEALHARGAGPKAIFDRLRLEDPEFKGSLSAVKRAVLRLRQREGPRAEDVAIRVETMPGEIAQVDFGYVGVLFDPEQRVMRRAWVFVLVLGFSRHQFAAIVFDQKIETWIDLHVRAFESFGGVPEVIVPDNLKSAVIRAAFGVDDEVVLNRSYREIARYYGFRIDPTPPRSPEKKGKVEADVRYVRNNFLATCESLDVTVVRRELERWVMEIAGRRLHGTTGKPPLELFEREERAALRPLPAERYERVLWKKAKLHRDSHVQIDGAFYSAPWRLIGRDLWARCTTTSVALHLDEGELIYTHRRVSRGQRSTVESHLPEHRAELRQRGREYWEDRAAAIGSETLSLVRQVFDSDDVLLQLRRVQAILRLLGSVPPHRAEAASKRATHFGNLEYRAIKRILSRALDLEPLEDDDSRGWLSTARFSRSASDLTSRHLLIAKG